MAASVIGLCATAAQGAQKTVQHWIKYEAMLTSMGKLRTDRDPPDMPFTNADLVRDFRDIMLHREHGSRMGRIVRDGSARKLKKLPQEVHVQILGSDISERDKANIGDLFRRLQRVTGVRLLPDGDDPMIRLLFLNRHERATFAKWATTSPRWNFIANHVANDLGDAVCATYYSRDRFRPGRFDYIIVIPEEVRGIVRRSCIEEEVGQTFGPGADSDIAKPSIFNDNQDFALMTTHDEMLLRILYDPRLRAGMTSEQAMPLVAQIVEELRPGQ